jgi:hypothetical protein
VSGAHIDQWSKMPDEVGNAEYLTDQGFT